MKRGSEINWDKVAELACSILVSAKSVGYLSSNRFADEKAIACRKKAKLIAKELGLKVSDGPV